MRPLVLFVLLLVSPVLCPAGSWSDLGSGTTFNTNACSSNYGSSATCSTGACTSANYAFIANCANRIRSWNGGAIYANGTKFMIGMGGHQDYYGDEMASVNLLTNVTSNLYTPCFNFASGSSPCASNADGVDVLGTGAPNSRHLYYGLTCVDSLSTCYMFSTGLTYGSQPARYMWKFPYSGNSATSWVRTTQFSTGASSPLTTACDWDPGTGRNRILCMIDNSRIFQYNTGTDTWTPLVTAGLQSADGFTIHPVRDIAVMAGDQVGNAGVGLSYMYLDNRDGYAVHDVTSIASATCGALLTGKSPGLAYDPNDGLLVGKDQNTSTIYILNPATWTCTTDNPSGGPTTTNTPQGMFGRFRYSSALNKFVVLQDYDQNVFAYQRTYGLGRSTAVCHDVDGDGYGVGQVALNPAPDLAIAPAGATPGPPSVSVAGTTGSTTYYYFLSTCYLVAAPVSGSVGVRAGCSIPSTGHLVSNSNATLSAINHNTITWTDTGSWSYQVLRTTTSTVPSGTGNFAVFGIPDCLSVPGTCTMNDENNAQFSYTVAQSSNVTSASHPFTAADFGKTITVYGGAGFTIGSSYTIQAVTSGVASLSGGNVHYLGLTGTTGGSWRYDGCLGPDADDLDATVHTGPEFVTKWTTLKLGLAHQGYSPVNFWYLNPATGSDSNTCHDTTGSTNIGTPCATYGHLVAAGLAAGDMVLFRGGDYTDVINVVVNGTAGAPLILKAYPGEIPTLRQQAGIGALDRSWLIVDGLTLNSQNATGSMVNGGSAEPSTDTYHDNIFRNMHLTNASNGFYMFNGMTNLILEDNVAHDMHGTTGHCFYTGARGSPNANLQYQRNIAYNCDYTGIQHNGRVTNYLLQQNIIHSTLAQCVSLEQGVSHSIIRGNLIFNCHNAGMVIAIYDQDARNGWGVKCPDDATVSPGGLCNCDLNSAYCPHDENFNLIENNTFYQTGVDLNGSYANGGAINWGTQDRAYIRGTNLGPFNTTTNNSLQATIDNVPYTFTLTSGASRTAAQIATDINGVLAGAANGASGALNIMSPALANTVSNISVVINATATMLGLSNTAVPTVVQPVGFPRDLGNNTFRNNIFYGAPGIAGSGPEASPPGLEFNERQTSWITTTRVENSISHSLVNGADDLVVGWGQCGSAPDPPTCGSSGWASLTCAQAASTGMIFPNGTSTDCKNVIPTFAAASPAYFNLPLNFNLTPLSTSPAVGAGSTTSPPPSDVFGNNYTATPNIGGIGTLSGCTLNPLSLGPWTITQSSGFGSLTAVGCSSSTYSCTSLPTGLSINSSTGAITGTISASGTFNTLCSYSTDVNQPYTILVNAVPAITTSGALPSVVSGFGYSQTLATSGGTSPLTCAIFSGTLSGSGLTLNSNCTITGTAATAATYTFTAKATDTRGVSSAAGGSTTITVNPSVSCSITPTTLGPYTQSLSIGTVVISSNSCGGGTLTWTSSGLPAGLSGCNSVTGTTCNLTGTPTTATTYTPTISVSDGGSNSASINPVVVVSPLGNGVGGTVSGGYLVPGGAIKK